MAQVRFDSLPDELIIGCILSKIGDARALVRCAAVCKHWSRLTADVPALHFDFPRSWRQDYMDRASDAEKIVSRMITRNLRGGVHELSVRFSPSEQSMVCLDESSLQAWIKLVSSSIKELKLSNKGCAFSELIPSLSECTKLSSLSLEFGYFDGIPVGIPCFRELKRCHFSNVIFHGDDLQKFVSLCPVLEELCLDQCFATEVPDLAVHSDTVQCLKITDSKFCKMSVKMRNLKVLVLQAKNLRVEQHSLLELSILSSSLQNSFGDLSKLRKLSVNGKGWVSNEFMKILELAVNLKELNLMASFSTKDVIPGDDLIRSVKRLERLTISSNLVPALSQMPKPNTN